MKQANLDRINELAHLAKERELTPEEQAERAKLRKEYLQNFRSAFELQLQHTVIQREDGTKEPLHKKGQ